MNPINQYDFTSFATGHNPALMCLALDAIAKRWAFQREECPKTKKPHWQGRVSLHKKKRLTELKAISDKTVLKGAHWSPTSNAGKGKMSYVMKLDTRIDGPWTDEMPRPTPMPADVKLVEAKRLPWQTDLLGKLCTVDEFGKDTWDRKINILYHKSGNIGGTLFGKWLQYKGFACMLPPAQKIEDLMAMVLCKPTATAYYIDVPREIKGGSDFWSGIETLKGGYAYDKRYKFREKMFTPPHVWLKMNYIPDRKHLSADRWDIWTVNGAMELVPWVADTPPAAAVPAVAAV